MNGSCGSCTGYARECNEKVEQNRKFQSIILPTTTWDIHREAADCVILFRIVARIPKKTVTL